MHTFKNFKNFAEVSLNLMSPLVLMIGRNGAGKSNAIEAVELLAQIAHGRPLYEITDVGRGSGLTFQIRGGLAGCLKQDQDELGLPGLVFGRFKLGFQAAYKGRSFSYSVEVKVPQAKIFAEELTWGDISIFKARESQSGEFLDVTYNNFSRGGKKPIRTIAADRSVLSQYEYVTDFGLQGKKPEQKDAIELAKVIERHLNSAYVFDPNPKQMRNYERYGQAVLNKDGSNISSVLYELSQGNDDKKATLQRIFEKINQLPDEQFSEFEFISTQLYDVLLAFKSVEGTTIDARLLSEGTLRALAILTALETVPEHSRIIIEEMDNGIHPSRVEMLVEAIWECSNRRKLNVLATTHNPATLDCLSDKQIDSVVLCYYDQSEKASKITPIKDLPLSDLLLERGKLGDLVTKRVIEQHLMPGFEEDRKKKAQDWLESFYK